MCLKYAVYWLIYNGVVKVYRDNLTLERRQYAVDCLVVRGLRIIEPNGMQTEDVGAELCCNAHPQLIFGQNFYLSIDVVFIHCTEHSGRIKAV